MEQTRFPQENRPLVSVIMPAYNCERFIEAAVRSVMAQTVTDWELLILDDSSADGTYAIASGLAQEDARIHVLQNRQNMGVAKTRNRGMDLAQGAYVAFLDSDDIWHSHKLEKQLAQLKRTGADFCYTSYAIVDAWGKQSKADYLVPQQITFDELLKANVLGCSTVLLHWDKLKDYRFRTDFYHEDYVLWLTLLKNGYRACGCREVLTDWRLLSGSRSFNKIKAAKNRWRIYTDYLGLPFFTKMRAFSGYAAASLRKYW